MLPASLQGSDRHDRVAEERRTQHQHSAQAKQRACQGVWRRASQEPAKEEVIRPQPEPPGEATTLSGAIQRLIAERDGHKSRAGTQELELTRLRAVNDELRRQHEQTALIRDHYMRLATEVLTTLRHIDYTIHEVVQKTLGASGGSEGYDATLISLARRLSPKGGTNGNVENHL